MRNHKRTIGIVTIAAAIAAFAALFALGRRKPASPDVASGPAGASGAAAAAAPELATADTAVEGVVVGSDGTPVSGATVTAMRQRGKDEPLSQTMPTVRATTSGAEGRFRINGLAAGAHVVGAVTPDGSAHVRDVQVKTDQTTSGIELRLGRDGVLLTGRVLEAGGGPIAAARVQALHWLTQPGPAGPPEIVPFETRSAEDGSYRLRIPRGRTPIVARADGYATANEFTELGGDTNLDIRMQPAARISGVVLNADGRVPVPNAEVRAEAFGAPFIRSVEPATTDERGRFDLTSLGAGTYKLSARSGGMVGSSAQPLVVTVAAPADDVELVIKPGATLSGKVTSLDGKPIPGANVEVMVNDPTAPPVNRRRVRTDDAGQYSVDGLEHGNHRMMVGADGWAATMQELAIAGPTTRDVKLQPGVVVTGIVQTSAGAPAAGVTVEAIVAPRGSRGMFGSDQTKSDAQGKFELKRLVPGELTIRARSDAEATTFGPESLGAGERKSVTIKLGPGARVSGTVTWDDGTPAANVTVKGMIRGGAESTAAVQSGTDGAFSLAPFPPGEISVVAMQAGERIGWSSMSRPEQADLTVTAGEQKTGVKLVVPKRNGTISGIVIDSSGRPVDGASVRAGLEQNGRAWRSSHAEMVTSAPDGSFTIEGLAKGKYTLWAEHPKHADGELTGVESGAKRLKLSLPKAATVEGAVVDGGGKPLPDYTIRAIPAKSGESAGSRINRAAFEIAPVRVNDARGSFKIERLAAGTYDLLATAASGAMARIAGLVLTAGEDKRGVKLVVEDGVTVTGRVVEYETGNPLPDVQVTVRGVAGASAAQTTTDGQGAFTLAKVPQLPSTMLSFEPAERSHVWETRAIGSPEQGRVDLGTIRMLKADPKNPDRGRAGMRYSVQGDKIVIDEVKPELPAAKAGIKKGDVILKVDGAAARDPGDLQRALSGDPDKVVTVTVQTGNEPPREVKVGRLP